LHVDGGASHDCSSVTAGTNCFRKARYPAKDLQLAVGVRSHGVHDVRVHARPPITGHERRSGGEGIRRALVDVGAIVRGVGGTAIERAVAGEQTQVIVQGAVVVRTTERQTARQRQATDSRHHRPESFRVCLR